MIRYAAGVTLALGGALLVTTAGEVPAGPGVAVLALVLALFIAAGGRPGVFVIGALAIRPSTTTDARPARAAEITDPRRHPLRPRAPGLA